MTGFRFDHLHVRSADAEAAADFYVRAFSARIVDRQHPGGRLRVVLDLAGVRLFVEAVPEDSPQPPPPPFRGLEHLGLTVDDLDAVLADLAAKGIALESGPSSPRPGVRIAFVAAPDGARVELIERRG